MVVSKLGERVPLFDYIKGKIQFVGPEYIVIETSGIGFQIMTPNPFLFSSKIGTEMFVYTYHYFRQDNMSLYGFLTREEKLLFTKLLNVSGIGPKGALAILAGGDPGQIATAIEREDEAFLVKFPGVGKKTARQMILDLKGKLDEFLPDLFTDPNHFAKKIEQVKNHALDEAILALQALGYSEKELKRIVKHLEKEQLTTEQYIKKGLQFLLK